MRYSSTRGQAPVLGFDDVRLAVEGRSPVRFLGKMGGVFPLPADILEAIETMDAELAAPQEA